MKEEDERGRTCGSKHVLGISNNPVTHNLKNQILCLTLTVN